LGSELRSVNTGVMIRLRALDQVIRSATKIPEAAVTAKLIKTSETVVRICRSQLYRCAISGTKRVENVASGEGIMNCLIPKTVMTSCQRRRKAARERILV